MLNLLFIVLAIPCAEGKTTEALCLKYQKHCQVCSNKIFPQHHRKKGVDPIHFYNCKKDQSCKKPPKQKVCLHGLPKNQLPTYQFMEPEWYHNLPLKKEANCVRYENKCKVAFVALDVLGKGWEWFLEPKNCPVEDIKKHAKDPMACVAHLNTPKPI